MMANSAEAQDQASLRFEVPPSVSRTTAAALKQKYALFAAMPRAPVPTTVAEWDRRNDALEARALPAAQHVAGTLGLQLQEEVLGGVPVLRIRPPQYKPRGRTFLYLHGGGYVLLSAKSNLTVPALLAIQTGEEVISIDYTLAPRSMWDNTTNQVLSVWRALLKQGKLPADVGLLGDSAGGGLAAGSVLKMRDQSLPLPGALWLLSPATDLTASGDTQRTLIDDDPILNRDVFAAAVAYARPEDQRNPYVSPVYGDYSKAFPPTLIQAGTHELLLSDSVREYQAIRNGGHEAVLDVYEGMPHVFQFVAPDSVETKTAVQRAAAFFDAHLGRRPGKVVK